jgi:hypothetical protein
MTSVRIVPRVGFNWRADFGRNITYPTVLPTHDGNVIVEMTAMTRCLIVRILDAEPSTKFVLVQRSAF